MTPPKTVELMDGAATETKRIHFSSQETCADRSAVDHRSVTAELRKSLQIWQNSSCTRHSQRSAVLGEAAAGNPTAAPELQPGPDCGSTWRRAEAKGMSLRGEGAAGLHTSRRILEGGLEGGPATGNAAAVLRGGRSQVPAQALCPPRPGRGSPRAERHHAGQPRHTASAAQPPTCRSPPPAPPPGALP